MPQSEKLSVRFVGEDGSLTKSLGSLQDQLKRFEKGLKEADNATSFNKIQKAIIATKSRIDTLQRSGGQLGQALGTNFKRGSDQATQSLINLSRVAQDAPYGFIGIANNLNPLLESFQRLKTETGSSKTALQALVTGLTGPAGIGLALGVVSSLLVTFGDKLFGTKDKVESVDESFKKFTDSLKSSEEQFDKFIDNFQSLQRLGDINLKIAGLPDVLSVQAKSVDLSEQLFKARERANEINKQISEQSTIGIFGKTDEIKAEAKKRADELFNSLVKTNDTVKKLEEEQRINFRQIELQKVEDQREANKEAEAERKKSLDKLKEQFDRELKIWEERQLEIKRFLKAPISDGNEEFREMMERSILEINPSDNLTKLRVPLTIIPEIKIDKDALDKFTKEELVNNLNNAIQQAATQMEVESFAAIGDAIGAALTGGDIGSVFKNLFVSLGSAIQQLGQQIIQIGVLAKLTKKAIANLLTNPGAALFAGIALTALGAAIKSAGKVKGFAEGGLAFGATLGVVGEGRATNRSNPEVIAPLNKLSQFLGGTNNNNGGTLRLRGTDLLLAVARNNKYQRRVH
jgi:hypothetical protein